MPLYEYHCHRCDQTFEVRQKFSDEPLAIHKDCGGEVERLLSAPALQFKGSGWYVTDYGRNGNSSASSDNKPKTDQKADSKGESKPAAASTPPPASKSE